MKEKSLLVRFGVLAVVLILAGLVLAGRPMKKGMDLAGGHSLVFKVDTEGDSGVLEQVIDVLKDRIDPEGIRNLEMRAQGQDRIEIRMPGGTSKARAAREAYADALKALSEHNTTSAFIRRVLAADDAERRRLIEEKLGLQTPRGEKLLEAAQLSDRMRDEWARIEGDLAPLRAELERLNRAETRPVDQIAEVEGKIDTLRAEYDRLLGQHTLKLKELRDLNVNTRELAGIMGLYVAPQASKSLPKADYEDRQKQLDQRLAAFRRRYADAGEEVGRAIEGVVATYRQWARTRGRLDDPEDLIRLVRRAGVLEFRIAPSISSPEDGSVKITMSKEEADGHLRQLAEKGPQFGRDRKERYQWFKIRDPKEEFPGMVVGSWGGERHLLLSDEPEGRMLQTRGAESWELKNPSVGRDNRMRPAVFFGFDDRGAGVFGDLTGSHLKEHMAILLDDEVYSAPVIRSQIFERGIIEGRFTGEEVADLVRTLRAGSLRARINPDPISVHSIGPTLGEVNIHNGLRAGYTGMACVVAFMAAYYLLGGLIANFALALNVVLILAVMAMFEVAFTLPGIAGVILTMGIAVDANVLIFERLREEQSKPQSLRMAIRNAYQRAFSAIIDGNITTILTCVILAWVGTQEVRGFGITLGVGIAISLFTSLLVTRWIFRLLDETNLLKNKVWMLRLMGVPKVDWISKRHAFWAISLVVIAAGLASLIGQGPRILGIEFNKGTRAVIRLRDDALLNGRLPTDAAVAEALAATARRMGAEYELLTGQNVQVNVLRTETRVADFIRTYDARTSGGDGDGKVSLAEWTRQERNPDAFRLLDAGGDGVLDAAELEARLPEPRYQIGTSEFEHQKVSEAIREAFSADGGLLDTQSSLKDQYRLLAGETVADLRLAVGPEGFGRIEKADFDDPGAGGSFREELLDNVDGVLMAFELKQPSDAMTPAELRQRLRATRLQAGREEVQVVETQILPLAAVSGRERYTAFAVVVRTEEIARGERFEEAWRQFAQGERELLTSALDYSRSLESLSNFDPAMTLRSKQLAIVAIVLSWLGIIGYLWLRFGSPAWGLAAVICLIHDTFVVLGLVAACYWIAGTPVGQALGIEAFKVDLTMVAALLTVIGYSVNDTIVVFDRIRENRGKLRTVTAEIVNRSINETLGRTLLTSCTTLLVVVVMYVWGGEGIHGFSFALMMGILFGTYSSVAIASPLLLWLNRRADAGAAGK